MACLCLVEAAAARSAGLPAPWPPA
uniref:Uncharacterized protein n=1 Tax=Arundo donax TaxID=35708 RepID=A0A0A8Z1L1_ARUDO